MVLYVVKHLNWCFYLISLSKPCWEGEGCHSLRRWIFFFREQSKYTPLVLIVYTVCFRQHSCHVFIVSRLNNFISLSQPHFSVSCCNCMISPFFNWHWTEVFFPHCFRCLDVTSKLYQYWLLEPKHNSIRHCKHTRQHKRKIYRHFKVSNALYCKF